MQRTCFGSRSKSGTFADPLRAETCEAQRTCEAEVTHLKRDLLLLTLIVFSRWNLGCWTAWSTHWHSQEVLLCQSLLLRIVPGPLGNFSKRLISGWEIPPSKRALYTTPLSRSGEMSWRLREADGRCDASGIVFEPL